MDDPATTPRESENWRYCASDNDDNSFDPLLVWESEAVLESGNGCKRTDVLKGYASEDRG